MARHTSFGERVFAATGKFGPLCVGIDPSREQLAAWGLGLSAIGAERYALTMIEAVAGLVAAVKPQVAFFEQFGGRGMIVLERILSDARDAGLIVIADAKRSDIGSTAAAYASAWLDEDAPYRCDALTLTPYLGVGALKPCFDAATASGRGVFVVARSSNPEGVVLQEATAATGRTVEDQVLAEIAAVNGEIHDGSSLGPIGAVVGATRTASTFDLATMGGAFLIPGVGAQGGTAAEVAARFAGLDTRSLLVNQSRSIASAGPEIDQVREKVLAEREGLRIALAAS
ncbi:MAG: orotidine-5'-phosphate decarboxylase [Actinomycetes bacterium]